MGHCSDNDLSLEAYQYLLPPGYIAQNPIEPRDQARLMAVTSPTEYHHHHVFDLPTLLRPGDLLVLNNTKVIPARLYGHKHGHKLGGAKVEVLLLEARGPLQWLALVKPGRRLQPGAVIHFGANPAQPELIAQVTATEPETGGRLLDFTVPSGEALETLIDRLGQMPLPPYITASEALPERYQTIYAKYQGAVAAPTAGLHFTQQLFEQLATAGINHAFLTLHVGVGTFRPVEADVITDHQMHGEWLDVPEATVAAIQTTQAQGGRVIAVGTTVIRALEGAAQDGILQPFKGKTNLFIYPGYRWQVVDGLMTNFHLPGSSLLMLVSALVGRQRLMDLYQEAIVAQYRFYSFGDAMVILPEARVKSSGD